MDINGQQPIKRVRDESQLPTASLNKQPRIDLSVQTMTRACQTPHLQIKAFDVNMPALVVVLQRHLLQTQHEQHNSFNHGHFKPLIASTHLTDSIIRNEFQNTLKQVKDFMLQARDLQVDDELHIIATFGPQSLFGQYDTQLVQLNDAVLQPRIIALLNTLKACAKIFVQLPNATQLSMLKHFPPATDQNTCIDGTTARLEQCRQRFQQCAIELNIEPPTTLLQQLDPHFISGAPFILNVLDTCLNAKLLQEVDEGRHIHVPIALQQKLGVCQKLISRVDGFALNTLNTLQPFTFYTVLENLKTNALTQFHESIAASQVGPRLTEYQQQLESALASDHVDPHSSGQAQSLDSASVFNRKINEIRETALSRRLVQEMPKSQQDQPFEQLFGHWNDSVTALIDWDWALLQQCLDQAVSSDTAMSNRSDAHSIPVELMNNKNSLHILNINEDLKGAHGDQGQYLALQGLNALADAALVSKNSTQYFRLSQLFVNLTKGSSTVSYQELKLRQFQLETSRQLQTKGMHPINEQLLKTLNEKLIPLTRFVYPYYYDSVAQIKAALLKMQSAQDMAPGHIVTAYGIHLNLAAALKQVEQYHLTKPDHVNVDTLYPQLKRFTQYTLNLIAIQKEVQLLKAICNDDDLYRHIITKEIERLGASPGVNSQILATVFTHGGGQPVLDLLSNDALHQQKPLLADQIIRNSITHNHAPILKILQSTVARVNLSQNTIDHNNSIPTLLEHYSFFEKAPLLNAELELIAWPLHNYIAEPDTIAPEGFIKRLLDNNNPARFQKMYGKIMQLRQDAGYKALPALALRDVALTALQNNQTALFEAMLHTSLAQHGPELAQQLKSLLDQQ